MVDIEMLKRGLRCIAGIDREDLCRGCRYGQLNEECDVSIANDALALLKEQSQIVRCKDCKWHDNADISSKWLPCISMKTNPNWFCADGERKEGR